MSDKKPNTTQYRSEIVITRAWCPKCKCEMIGGKQPPPATPGAGVVWEVGDDTHHECSCCGHKEQYDRGYPSEERREIPISSDGLTQQPPI